jgi:signal transduction histidine kinase
MKSIRARLNGWLAMSLVLVFIALGIGTSISIRLLTEAYIGSRLEHDAEALLGALVIPADGASPWLRPGRLSPVYHRPLSGHYYLISVGDAVLRSRSLWDQDLMTGTARPGQAGLSRQSGPDDQFLLVRTASYRKENRTLMVTVAEDMTPIRADVRRFQLRFIAFSLFALLLLLVIQAQVLRRGLVSLARMHDELGELESGRREQLTETVPQELYPLVTAFNRLQRVMQQRLSRSRHALGDLAHALKTPLTLLGQLAGRPELEAHAALCEDLRGQVAGMHGMMEGQLRRARLAGAGGTGRVQVAGALSALVDVMRHVHHDRGLDIAVTVSDDAMFVGDREDLLELLGNLLDNACKWARHRVRVAVTSQDGLRIVVEDDGAGVDPARL